MHVRIVPGELNYMKYQILFTHQFSGVWTYHETLESAQHHINTLVGMASGNNISWTIFHEGQELKSNKVSKNSRSITQTL